MAIFRLAKSIQSIFGQAPEIFANAQFGKYGDKYLLIVGCQVALEFDENTPSELEHFYDLTWGTLSSDQSAFGFVIERYESWIKSLPEIEGVEPHLITRAELTAVVSSSFPPPPPNRPTLVPRYLLPPILPQNFYGHLPFKTKTRLYEHFYRFEPWPTSRKIVVGNRGVIGAQTYASPSAELRFLNTGFAVVARNALPSFFPAVFRYELQPAASRTIHCGAIVPNFGQSGGGVEVYFLSQVQNRGPIASPVVIPPL
jgi:hypothetical protein